MPASRSTLRPIATPHPLVILLTLVVAGALIGLALNPKFHPPIILYAIVSVTLIAINQWSRMRQAKLLQQQQKPLAETRLKIDLPGK